MKYLILSDKENQIWAVELQKSGLSNIMGKQKDKHDLIVMILILETWVWSVYRVALDCVWNDGFVTKENITKKVFWCFDAIVFCKNFIKISMYFSSMECCYS